MGERKSQSRGDQTRARLLQATRSVLVDGGAAAFSMRAVATRAEVGLSRLQFHYPQQQALLSALLDEELRVGERLVAAALLRDEPTSQLERALDALLQQHRDVDTMKVYLALWSFAAHDDVLRAALSSFYARFVAAVVDACAPFTSTSVASLQQRARVAVALLEGASLFRSGVAGAADAYDDALLRRTLIDLLTGPDSPAFTTSSTSEP